MKNIANARLIGRFFNCTGIVINNFFAFEQGGVFSQFISKKNNFRKPIKLNKGSVNKTHWTAYMNT